MPRMGISETSVTDALRSMAGSVLIWWLVLDDTMAPGARTTTMMDMVMKRYERLTT